LPLSAKDFRIAQFVVKTAPEAPPMISEIRARLLQAGVAASSVNIRSVENDLRGGLRDQKFRAMLFSAFGITALALAALGLYAVGAYEVAQRRREGGRHGCPRAEPPISILRQFFECSNPCAHSALHGPMQPVEAYQAV
jgi:hypothetical protein